MQLEDSLPDIEDTDGKDDPVFDCPEYANDIYQYLLEVSFTALFKNEFKRFFWL